MTKDFWLNLPVKNLEASKAFFRKLGFRFNENSPGYNATMAPLILGEKGVIVMLVEQNLFGSFTSNGATDTQKGTEVLMSIDAESREEVDELARKAEEAGGTVYGKPGESQGWMYGCGFTDLDGHRWNVLFMDFEKMPK